MNETNGSVNVINEGMNKERINEEIKTFEKNKRMKSSGSVSVLCSHCSAVVLRRCAGQSGPGRQGV